MHNELSHLPALDVPVPLHQEATERRWLVVSTPLLVRTRTTLRSRWSASVPLIVLALSGAATLAHALDIRTPPALVKVLQDDPWPRRVPAPHISLQACRGEVEWGQIVLRSDTDVPNLRAAAMPWCVERRLAARSTMPEISLHPAHYVLVDRPSGNRIRRRARWPDPLPVGEEFSLSADLNQAVYVCVDVPVDCAPGLYRSTVTLRAGGQPVREVPLHLVVWDIEIPATPTMRTSYYVWWDGIRERYGLGDNIAPLNRFFWFLVDRRICPMTLPVPITDARADHYMADRRVNGVRVRFTHDEVELRGIVEHVRDKGWLDRTYIYLFDEPARRDWYKIHEASDLITSIEPRMARLDSIQPEPELAGKVSIWCPNAEGAYLFRDRIAPRQAAGDEVWWYTCVVPKYPYPNYLLDDDALGPRVLFWMQTLYGMTGSMYINTIHWGPEGWDPWERGVISMPRLNNNHDGLLMYSGRELDGCYPVTSVRLEMIRDGIEDYELFGILRREARSAARKLGLTDPDALADRWVATLCGEALREAQDFERHPTHLLRARRKTIQTILRLRSSPGHVMRVAAPRRPAPPGPMDPRKFLDCPRLTDPPAIDGDISDACWNAATEANRPGMRTVVTRFRNLTGRIWPSQNTILVNGWHNGSVYVAMFCQEPDVKALVRSGDASRADHVWLSLADGRGLLVTAGGELVLRGDWTEARPRVGVTVDEDGYGVEIALPAQAMGLRAMRVGVEAPINFGRYAAPGHETLAWVSRHGSRESPGQLGTLTLR